VPFAGSLTGRVGYDGRLLERQLQAAQPVAQRPGVLGADLRSRGVTRAASTVMSLRASSRSGSTSWASPTLTAAALMRCTAAAVITSTAGTSAMSRVT
jgi:hypothetical protein